MKTLILSTLSLVFIIVGTTQSAFAVNAGQKSPHDLTVKDHNGDIQSFDNLSGDKGLAVFFIRSVDWCPFCQSQLVDLNKHISRFEKHGYKVAALSYDPVVSLKRFKDKKSLSYTLLSDPDSEVIRAFNLLNEDVRAGSKQYGIPHPAIVIIGKDKMIQTFHQENGYKKRPDLNNILDTLGSL